MNVKASMKFNDKEVKNPFLRFLLALVITAIVIVVVCLMTVAAYVLAAVVCIMVLMVPFVLGTDALLKRTGRKGFVHRVEEEFAVEINGDSFRKID